MINRYLIALALIAAHAAAIWFVSSNEARHVPKPIPSSCQGMTCNMVQRVMILRRVA